MKTAASQNTKTAEPSSSKNPFFAMVLFSASVFILTILAMVAVIFSDPRAGREVSQRPRRAVDCGGGRGHADPGIFRPGRRPPASPPPESRESETGRNQSATQITGMKAF